VEPLVGIVVVSHSARLAEGTVELVLAATNPGGELDLRVLPVGGTADGEIGTDGDRIAAALEAADAGAGVVVVADLGSAILATNTALMLMDPERADRVRLSSGPLVEGAYVAATAAAAGRSLDDVLAQAVAARDFPKDV